MPQLPLNDKSDQGEHSCFLADQDMIEQTLWLRIVDSYHLHLLMPGQKTLDNGLASAADGAVLLSYEEEQGAALCGPALPP